MTEDTAVKPRKKKSLTLGIISALMLTGGTLACLWFAGFIAFILYVWTLSPAPVTNKTDAIIVITGGAQRVNTGFDLLRDEVAGKLFISGVDARVTPDTLLAHWGGDAEKIACCIILGHQAQNTEQNATETRDWIEKENIKSVRLVTSGYHIPRSLLEFHHAMPDVEIVIHPVDARELESRRKWFWMIALEEYNKTLLVTFRQYLRPPSA